jgi:hypothetical protein
MLLGPAQLLQKDVDHFQEYHGRGDAFPVRPALEQLRRNAQARAEHVIAADLLRGPLDARCIKS